MADTDLQWLTIGLTRKGEQITWNAGYMFGFDDWTVSGAVPNFAGQTANGDYKSRHHNFLLSVKYDF